LVCQKEKKRKQNLKRKLKRKEEEAYVTAVLYINQKGAD